MTRRWFGREVHPLYIVIIFAFALVGYCHADAIDLEVPGGLGTPISIPEPTADGIFTSSGIICVLTGLAGMLVTVILHDILSTSQPTATSQGVPSEKPDKNIMDVNELISRLSGVSELISRLSGRIVAIDDRLARWKKNLTKLEKQHEEESQRREAADFKMAAFDETIDKAVQVSAILASVAPTTTTTRANPVGSFSSSPFKFSNRERQHATYSNPVKPDSDSDSLSEAETVAEEVAACGVEIPADSESQWILVTRKKNKSNQNVCQPRG